MHMSILFVYMPVHHIHALYLWRSEEGIGSTEYGVTCDNESSCGQWDIEQGHLEEPSLFLTVVLSLWPWYLLINNRNINIDDNNKYNKMVVLMMILW